MNFDDFETRAWEMWEQIPDNFKAGIDGLIIERDAKAHPEITDIYTLGECVTEAYPSEFGGPDTIRSAVVLYYGSFRRLSRKDEAFDWEDELWETLTHELRHHLESLAAEDALEGVDYAADENFKRLEGDAFDPDFYRVGEPAGEGRWRIEREWFVEVPLPEEAWVVFEWEGRRWRVPRPEPAEDVNFVEITGGPDPGDGVITLVVIRPRSFGAVLRRLLSRTPIGIGQLEAEAEPVE